MSPGFLKVGFLGGNQGVAYFPRSRFFKGGGNKAEEAAVIAAGHADVGNRG